MGCMISGDAATQQARGRSKSLDKQLKSEFNEESKIIKLLLLGAGESGKSTIFKQMKIIHSAGYSEEERRGYIQVIHSNIISSMKVILNAAERCSIDLSELQELVNQVQSNSGNDLLEDNIADTVAQLWAHPSVQLVYDRRNEFQLNDSAKYYFDQLAMIATSEYLPSEQDVLRARVRTTGIVESNFNIDALKFRMFDVGGQRSERRKWIHCFDDVTAVMFVAAMSEYDQVLFEDASQNRMTEALNLFDQICNSTFFVKTHFILFLNKRDLFEDKIKRKDLSSCFPDYTGGCDYEKASEFIEKKFVELNTHTDKTVFVHITCATDTNNIRFVFDAMKDIITQKAIEDAGVLL